MNLSLQHSFQILIKGNKYDEDEMVCTGGINRPCQGDGGAPLVCFKLKSKKKIKNFEINFFNRFARRIRVSGFYMAFQSMDQAAVSEITMAPQFSLGQARLYSLFVM